ncbi:MAG: hypothetical protein IJ851_05430, partial [Eubacterium sp.]|nr:hypothetical protein [Eubacterium sp.]
NYVVTEYGIAQLKGRTLKERAKALIRVSHPKFRAHLIREFRKRFNEEPFSKEELKELVIDDSLEAIHEARENIKDNVKQRISSHRSE